MAAVGDGGLVELYSQLECARSTAASGAFADSRAAYLRVNEAARRAAASVASDAALSQAWAAFLGNLREEQKLLDAWEAECKELEAAHEPAVPSSQEAAAVGRHGSALSGSSASASTAPQAFNVDLHSFEIAELPPARQAGSGAAGAGLSPSASVDPDVWSPADMPPGTSVGAPRLSGFARGKQRREREEAYERARRDILTPGTGGGGRRGGGGGPTPTSFSGVKPRVNTGAKRGPGGSGGGGGGGCAGDLKVAALDMMLDKYSGADQDLIQQLSRDVLEGAPDIRWDDVVGLEAAKEVLQENVAMPLLMSDLFAHIPCLRPLKGVLLFGPPGTGKTMLAKAVARAGSAADARTAFINVSASTLASKFRGESEKLVRLTFELARAVQPCVIFIDEIDALCSERGSQSEHEASRRMKTELLTQIDGMHSSGGGGSGGAPPPRVMVLAATNFPWAIDEALRRRMEKRIFIPLPQLAERRQLLTQKLKGTGLALGVDLEDIARRTEGYSGDDIANLVAEAGRTTARRVRQMAAAGRDTWDMSPAEQQAVSQRIRAYMQAEGICAGDFAYALQRSNPSCSAADVERHTSFAATFGCT